MIHDDGTICRIDDETFYLTVTTSGAEEAEALMIDWRDTWGMTVHIVNQTVRARRDQRRRARRRARCSRR